jgi:shikimate kinase
MMFNSQKVYIIGFMGSGKSTAGKKLASLLGWLFVDLDKKIEEYMGMTIPEIFSKHGEIYFREAETKVLRSLESDKNTVISAGGGAPCHSDNMSYMLQTGLTVYLKLTPVQLKGRLSESKGERPLLKNLNNIDLQTYIENKLALREKYYSQAEIHINGFDMDYVYLYSQVKKGLCI